MKRRKYLISWPFLALAISVLPALTSGPQTPAADEPQARSTGMPQAKAATKPAPPAAPSPVLTARDKQLLTEALRLKQAIGDEVWPGLASAAIPVIIYNEAYEFLTGPIAAPPPPPWVMVEKDDFAGQPYCRRPAQNPQAFAVNIGEQWVGSMTSLETMSRTAPLKLNPEFYVVAVLHEVFHAFQATVETARFRRTLALYALERSYPAEDPAFAKAWTEEGALLASALKAKDRDRATDSIRAFLAHREARRRTLPDRIGWGDYERQMEWLEGLAKYVEIRFYELAAARAKEPAFAAYKAGQPYMLDFIRLEKQLGMQKGDLRFYLSGMAQARLLDLLTPGWKVRFFSEGGGTEERLQALIR